MAVTIGADPEILVTESAASKRFRSVAGIIGGTKSKPIAIPGLEHEFTSGTAMQEDNVMLEFNVIPVRGSGDFMHVIDNALSALTENVLRPKKLRMSALCSALYEEKELQSPQAREFGCSPDMDAYTQAQADLISPQTVGNNRFAGGHIHLGFENPEQVPDFVIVQLCDAVMGLTEVRYSSGEGGQGMRRQLYGTAGRYRAKPYGIEYRTLSNKWLWHHGLRDILAKRALMLAHLIDSGDVQSIHRLYTEIPFGEVQACINAEDFGAADPLYKHIQALCKEVA
jgi:hypothetical protein